MKKNILHKVIVPAYPEAQEILTLYQKKGWQEEELIRIEVAKKLCQVWKEKRILIPPPAVPYKNDFWYLVQLFFMGRHIHKDNQIYKFDLGKEEVIYLEDEEEINFQEEKLFQPSLLLKKIFDLARINKQPFPISRDILDQLLQTSGDDLLQLFHIDKTYYKIIPIPFDIYLRSAKKMKFGKHQMNVFFDGYRLRIDGKITSLYGGNILFGGAPFIDSIWNNTINNSIYPKLIIIRRDYGY